MTDPNRAGMNASGWFPFAAVLAAVVLLTVGAGATVTSLVADRTSPGSGLSPYTTYVNVHQTIAWIAGLLAVIMAMVIVGTGGNAVARRVAFAGVGVFAVQATLGMVLLRGDPAGARIAHACVAPVFLAVTTALAVMGGKAWNRGPELVQDYGWPSLRSMGTAAPILVLLQTAMGAAFRHQAMGVLPHIVGAIVVALFIMIAGAFVTHQFPTHPTLRPTALTVMAITGLQVFLGMSSFIMRMVTEGTPPSLIAVTVAHVIAGALTLASTTVLMMQIRRNVTPKPRA